MATKKRRMNVNSSSPAPVRRTGSPVGGNGRSRMYIAIAGIVIAVLAVAAIGLVALNGSKSGPSGPALANGESIYQAQGGQWTNVTPDRLAGMLQQKDFTLVNVKTPYIGEITGTDLYIPYDQLTARAAELPKSKDAKILVYCRSGVESAQGAQTLLNLGYTNVWNLDGGMNAWTASGRTLVNLNR